MSWTRVGQSSSLPHPRPPNVVGVGADDAVWEAAVVVVGWDVDVVDDEVVVDDVVGSAVEDVAVDDVVEDDVVPPGRRLRAASPMNRMPPTNELDGIAKRAPRRDTMTSTSIIISRSSWLGMV
jgi:hypothetical protein